MEPSLGEVGDVPDSSSQGIFLSYRREDAAPYARLLQRELRERFPDVRVFMDLDSIEAGLPFAKVIGDALGSCAVLVALIGRQWATLADQEGHRRLDNLGDYVRFEVQTALERGVRVIPVLVDGAKPPQQPELPSGLQELAGLNALELSYGRYEYDAGRLLELIERALAAVRDREEADRKAQGKQPRRQHSRGSRPQIVQAAGNALGEVAQKGPESARKDQARSARLLADAERIAKSISVEWWKAEALADVAGALAATDPDRAERIARSITYEYERSKAEALADIAAKLAATDPDRADRLGDEAELIIRSLSSKWSKGAALASIAGKLAATHPDRAERILRSSRVTEAAVFADVAAKAAATDPKRADRLAGEAERIVQSITGNDKRVGALADVAAKLAATDPKRAARLADEAERIVESIADKDTWAHAAALADVAAKLEAIDPRRTARLADKAARMAESLSSKSRFSQWLAETEKQKALIAMSGALAASDPDRAERIAKSITGNDQTAAALTTIAGKLAATDPDRAERIAKSIGGYRMDNALADVAVKLAATDPKRAERIARSIRMEHVKAKTLVSIAEA